MRQTIPPERYSVAGEFTARYPRTYYPDYRITCHYISRYRHHRRKGPLFSIGRRRKVDSSHHARIDRHYAGTPRTTMLLSTTPAPPPAEAAQVPGQASADQVTAPPRTPDEEQNTKIRGNITREYSFLRKTSQQRPTPLKINKMKHKNKPTTDLQRPTHKPTF